jgi:type I restriction enzyme M protein
MLTGELKNTIDQIWNAFWAGGIANPIGNDPERRRGW